MDIFTYKLDFDLWGLLSKELENFLGRPIKDIEKEYINIVSEESSLESILCESPNINNLYEYYGSTSRYLYELIRWEATLNKQS